MKMRRIAHRLLLVGLLSACGGKGAPVAAIEPDVLQDVEAPELADTPTPPPTDDGSTAAPDESLPPKDTGTSAEVDVEAPPACLEGATVTVSSVAAPAGPLTVATQGAMTCVAWVDGDTVRARLLDLAGGPVGDTQDVHTDAAPVSNVEVLPLAEGFALFFSRGLLAQAAKPEDVVLYQARIGLDAAVTMPPTPVYTRFQLGRGAAVSDAGFHLLGVRDGEDFDTGELFRQASMVRANLAGEYLQTHFMLKAERFSFMRMHQNGFQVCSPHVGPPPEQALSYFLSNIFLPCGLPVPTILDLGPDATVVATSYQWNRAIWLVRDGAGPGGRAVMADTSSVEQTTSEVPWPVAPTSLAELSLAQSGDFVLYVDVIDGALATAVLTLDAVTPIRTLDSVPAPVLGLRAAWHEAGWSVAWLEKDRIQLRQVCPPMEL